MDKEKIEELLDRYLKRTTSPEEDELIERWLQNHENTGSQWNSMNRQNKDEWLSKTFSRINQTIDKSTFIKPKPIIRKKPVFHIAIAAAASILIGILLYSQIPALIGFWKTKDLTVYATTKGQRKLFVLSDGTRVWLNEHSELRYPGKFDENTREVYMSGEAYFDVRHDSEKTFIIHSGKFATTVLGTAFNISEDKNKQTIAVTVTRGKVSISNAGKTLAFITPNQQLSFNRIRQQMTKITVNADQVASWKQTDLNFEDVTFGTAVERLSMHFGVKITFSNENLKKCRFTGSNLAHDNLEDILQVMCSFNNANFLKNKDGSILIRGSGCN